VEEARRMKRLPPYLFTIVDNLKREVKAQGIDVIDFSMGNPDVPPPPNVIERLTDAMKEPQISRYSKWDGPIETKLRLVIADWYYKRFGVTLDPQTEVLPLIGSKEGIAHLALAYLNADDLALVPSPAYPVHFNGVIMAGGILYNLPLKEEEGYIPNLFSLPKETTQLTKLLILSYPHNPTTATCGLDFWEKVVAWGKGKNMIIVSDLAYSDFVYEGDRAHSILEVKDAREQCIEFHTLSKSYSMAGWRIGFCVGNKKILAGLAKTKSYCDFGIFRAVQEAAIEALSGPQDYVKKIAAIYKKRMDYFVDGLNRIGWPTPKPRATFYVWTRIPLKFSFHSSMEFCELLIRETGVAVSPGTGFGEYGEGYVRFALVEPEERMKMALERIQKILSL